MTVASPPSAAERLATRQQLQALIRRIEQRPPKPRVAAPSAATPSLAWLDSESGRVGYREFRYGPDHLVGEQALAPLFEVNAQSLHLMSRGNVEVGAPGTGARDLVFFDIETTGLGGAGATVFMVAIARIEGDELVLRQYVSPSPADEQALLEAVVRALALERDPVLVSYNGLTFDAPFLDERATLHRRRAGLQSTRHLDLLHTARRGYRGVLHSHRLATVEAKVLRVKRPELEVGGAEIPAWYFRFLRSGTMRFLDPLLDHNVVDVLSLAGLVAHLHEGVSGPSSHGHQSLALGRLALAARSYETAEQYLRAAIADVGSRLARESAMRDFAVVCRSLGRRADALAELELLADSMEHGAWARQQLAIYYEHHSRDFASALAHVRVSVSACRPGDEEAWAKRQARLERKLSREAQQPSAS